MPKKEAPYGTWEGSPITSDTVVADSIVFDDVLVDPITKAVYHLEERPKDNGRCVIVDTNAKKDVLPSPYSARDSVHDYGGAPAIVYNDIIYFSNDSKDPHTRNRIYALKKGASVPEAVTPENPLWRYANFAVHPQQTNLLVTIREDHTDDPNGDAPQNVVNTLCVVDTTTALVKVIAESGKKSFYATPVFNPSGNKIAWQQWSLPDMPWEGGIIYVADVITSGGTIQISEPVLVAGEKGKESANFPAWIDKTTLLFTWDGEKGNRFQNPFIFDTGKPRSPQNPKRVLDNPLPQDFAEPAWWLGLYPYAILDGGKYGAFTAFKDGKNILYVIGLAGSSKPVQIEDNIFGFVVAQHLRPVNANTFVFTGSESSSPGGVVLGTIVDPSSPHGANFSVLKPSVDPSTLKKFKDYISKPIPMPLEAPDHRTIYIVYYPPHSRDYSGSSIPGEKPPCIINVHGGPTGLEPQALNWTKMFYTSRGFGWLDVNYRGSSGYGRDYSELLNRNWGRFDVEDCKEAARILSGPQHSLIDVKRVAIRGGSAGGYTTLSSLTFAKEPKFYKTACSAFGGVADPTFLVKIIEKFEMQYIDTLFGCPPDHDAWDPWNPIKHVNKNFSVPLLMLHGTADGVVPIAVAQEFVCKIHQCAPSASVFLRPYLEEGHHFRQGRNIKDALDCEHEWYQMHLL
ncbi:Alpha/Beta hydrolase protein [Lanmaoa asiatica]|nr:Alpha/Beta hydrolase protein [Lanmaoa asiatica]